MARRVDARVLDGVPVRYRSLFVDASEIIVKSGPEEPHLPRKTPRGLREDRGIRPVRAIAIEDTIQKALLKIGGSIE
jgi:hypothetical protein